MLLSELICMDWRTRYIRMDLWTIYSHWHSNQEIFTHSFVFCCYFSLKKYASITTGADVRTPVVKRGTKGTLHQTGHACWSDTKADVCPLTFCSLFAFLKSSSRTAGEKMTLLLKWGVVWVAGARASKVQQEHDPKAQHGAGSML